MPDYKKMYFNLFRSQSEAINILQEAQRKTEEMYIEAEELNVSVIPAKEEEE